MLTNILSAVFALGIAFFHTILIQQGFSKKIKPKGLLFVIYPLAVLIMGAIDEDFALITIIVLFALTFVAIIGLYILSILLKIFLFIKDVFSGKRSFWKKIGEIVFLGTLAFLFFTTGPFFFVIFAFFIYIHKFIFPDHKERFLNLQANLPTSKIRSAAMGLVEVEGLIEAKEYLQAPIRSKKCIGYYYTIEEEYRDKEGEYSYKTIHTEQKCNQFEIVDETGKAIVHPDNLEFIWFKIDERYSYSGKRYTQYLLTENQKMLLIGKATTQNNLLLIVREEIKKVFAIAPITKVNTWNKNKPLIRQISMYALLLAFIISIILMVPINVENGIVTIHIGWNMFSW